MLPFGHSMAARAQPERDLDPLWKALADPTRRRILDLLRERPRTTGELADEFPTSRFAVMKHLAVLSDAGLVLSRRRWRERWNHLNAVPLQELVERWVRPYEAIWASGLLAVKRRAEAAGRPGAGGRMTKAGELGSAQVELEIPIDAPRAEVWRALVDDIGLWWRKDFFYGEPRAFLLEARPGGRLFEDWGDGRGMLWYTVVVVDAPSRLQMAGHLLPGSCGDSYGSTLLQLSLDEVRGRDGAARTVLRLSDSVFGVLAPDIARSLDSGWKALFGEGLKAHVERARTASPP